MPRRVLFVTWNLSRGGAQNVIYNIIQGLPEEFTPVVLHLNNDDLSMQSDFAQLGVKLYYLNNSRLSRRFWEFRKLIRHLKPDVVHSHLGPGYLSFYLFLKLLGIKRVYNTFHLGLYPDESKEWLTQLFISKYFLVTQESASKHSHKYHVHSSKQEVIYNGIDISLIDDEIKNNQDLGWENGIHIISIANFQPLKGYEMAFPTIDALLEKYEDLHYHVCGGPTYTNITLEWINDFVAHSNNSARIHLHGQVENVYPYCSNADIFLSTTEKELLPMSLLEAMAMGLPVVYSDVGGVSEVLGNNEFGMLIDPHDQQNITNALEVMIDDISLRNKYGKLAQKRVRDFDISKTLTKYYKYYSK